VDGEAEAEALRGAGVAAGAGGTWRAMAACCSARRTAVAECGMLCACLRSGHGRARAGWRVLVDAKC
jgi:hypothetical protein